jgi:hypothetical protein
MASSKVLEMVSVGNLIIIYKTQTNTMKYIEERFKEQIVTYYEVSNKWV